MDMGNVEARSARLQIRKRRRRRRRIGEFPNDTEARIETSLGKIKRRFG
jgi:hypothetical protein